MRIVSGELSMAVSLQAGLSCTLSLVKISPKLYDTRWTRTCQKINSCLGVEDARAALSNQKTYPFLHFLLSCLLLFLAALLVLLEIRIDDGN